MSDTSAPARPFRPVPFAPLDIEEERRADGVIVMRSRLPLEPRQPSLPAYLARHARLRPDQRWLAQRDRDGEWRAVTFGEAKRRVDALTQALIDLDIPRGKSLAILSGNSIEHALIMLAAMQAGVPVAPISAAYSLMSQDHGKLREVLATADPGVLFVDDGDVFAAATRAVAREGLPVIAARNPRPGDLAFDDLLAASPGPRVENALAGIDPDVVAKIMFTSGSTGAPKGVPLTHLGLVIAAESNLMTTGAMEEGRKVRLDWAPWSHVFGATTLSLSIIEGGTFYIDGGRPLPQFFGETLRNLAEIQPDLFMNVPAAIVMLVEAMEKDRALAARILEKMMALGYGGAALPADIVRRFQALAVEHTGHRITITCGYGATETGPGGGFVYWLTDATGTLGLPHPGFAMKLAPLDGERREVRIAGKAVMKGYVGRPDLNETIFDEEGFYRTGDSVVFADGVDPQSGLIFAGRLGEEFKLLNGTFVRVGAVRAAVLEATAPLLRDVVICGENQAFLGLLAWPNPDVLRAEGDKASALAALAAEVKTRLRRYNAENPGVASAIAAFRLLLTPPSIDLGEVTDKGSINQRAAQRHRAADVSALFADPPAAGTERVSS